MAPPPAPVATGSDGHRQPLTEAEKKEEQRLRRVIANRESARKTSLRRKALHADLEKKVAELTTENENLKKEKEVWTEKYQTLLEKQQQEANTFLRFPPPATFNYMRLSVVSSPFRY
ncbi:bZIP transcription factor 16-like [Brachypodium distachyon]|uniref:bZIP transcription factor 16-like n=1 Tax=Brachypodium distachyon TaxID=15368 RepID=UPI000D0D1DDA|nr:bZIP transcription factor 16-like [Brachypodium distachyon]|eukprot:XP_024310992.1 bZIP transcription factor 16-like [Brachypodium distachyon]